MPGKMKKAAAAALAGLSVLLLSSCGAEARGDYREVYRGTESITESLTEPEPEPQEFYFEEETDMAVFLPILKREKRDTVLEDRLRPYVKKIIYAGALLRYTHANNYYGESIFDFGDSGTHEPESNRPLTYTKIRDEFGTNREQLLNFFGTVFTDGYINSICEDTSASSMEEYLFEIPETEKETEPLFIEEREDGLYLSVAVGTKGMKSYRTEMLDVRYFDGKTAEIGVQYDHEYGCGYEIFHLRHDEGRGWRLDSKGKNYWVRTHAPCPMEVYTDGSSIRTETARLDMNAGIIPNIGFVFAHFNETSEEYIEHDGEKYYRVKNYFSIENMRKIFTEGIDEYKWEWDAEAEDFVRTDEPLLQPCLDKYIDGVFIESEGALYRREGAPVYEIDYPDYNGGNAVSAEIMTPALGDSCISVFICGNGETAMFLPDGKLVTDIPLKEAGKTTN